ncbi:ABC transporter permease [uncultured Amphritea sp.]|uniref:ABC transporter permease n=1 Tax=uncultured Amphritea sp. TaxID=981605 RepID=UPI0025D129DD|nr:ABC transporter permease [uncultured Amphritea sp.]
MNTLTEKQEQSKPFTYWLKLTFVRLGVLPFLLVLAIAIFAVLSDNFLTGRNMMNVLRQSSFLMLVAMGQMFTLLTGGFDLSVGTIVAITSVVAATVMAGIYSIYPESVMLAISIGILAGMAAGIAVGFINGLGVSVFNVNPFMMTLGMSSVGFGIALYMTGGTPVYGLPVEFSDTFGFGQLFGIPSPILVCFMTVVVLTLLANWTKTGRYFYAVGGNIKAAQLSGINTQKMLLLVYVISGAAAAVCGILLTARLDTGEANIGSSFPLESIAACVIAGVSLRGGVGRIENVVLGALFIGLITNGMNLARIESYLQTVVIGLLLITAVIADQIRLKVMANLQD